MHGKFLPTASKLILVIVLLCGICVAAFAADFTLSVGGQESIPFGVTQEEGASYSLYGEIPGMTLSRQQGSLVMEGSPTKAGEYSVTLAITAADGSQRNVTITVSVVAADQLEPPASSPSGEGPKVTKDPTDESVVEGESAIFIARAENVQQYSWELLTGDGTTIPCANLSGKFAGIRVSGADTEKLTLSDIPASLDGCKVRCCFVGAEGSSYSAYATLSVIARDAIPELTKDPTGETVDEGGLAQFVARADKAAQYQWMIQTPDDKSTYPMDDVSDIFPEIRVTGADTECLTIFDIPASMDGWKVYCIFSAPGGQISSSRAVIFVNAKPTQPTQAPEETEPPTTQAPTEAPTEATTQPTTAPTEATTQPTQAPTEPEVPSKPAKKGISFGTILLIIVVAAVVVAVGAGAVIVYLRIRERDEYEEYEEYDEEE